MFPTWSLCLSLLFASASIPDGLSGIQAFRPKSSAHTKRSGILMLFQNVELSPLSLQIANALLYCVYCFTADCLVSIVPTGWPLTCSSACFDPTVSARAQVECVLMRGKNLTCYLPTKYNNGMFHGALASWWMCSHTHTHDSRSLQALWYICYQCGRVLENSLSITTGSVRMRERERQKIVMEEKRKRSECEKTVEEGHSGFWQKQVPL